MVTSVLFCWIVIEWYWIICSRCWRGLTWHYNHYIYLIKAIWFQSRIRYDAMLRLRRPFQARAQRSEHSEKIIEGHVWSLRWMFGVVFHVWSWYHDQKDSNYSCYITIAHLPFSLPMPSINVFTHSMPIQYLRHKISPGSWLSCYMRRIGPAVVTYQHCFLFVWLQYI